MYLNPQKKSDPQELVRITITGLDQDGRGVGRVNGKVIFIEGGLPGEQVLVQLNKSRRKYSGGIVMEILSAAPERITPACEYFGVCGGCSMQHMQPQAQILAKEKVLADNLERLGNVTVLNWLPAVTGAEWGYRRKARLGVRMVQKKGGILVGFRERRSSYITSLHHCQVLDKRVSDRLPELHQLIEKLSCSNQIPQVEVAAGDDCVAFVFRHLVPITEADRTLLCDFGQKYDLQILLQPAGPDSAYMIWPLKQHPLSYTLAEFNIKLHFKATDFAQVNAEINEKMIVLAQELLDANTSDTILDLFCGLGNFTLPLAQHSRYVIGIEGEASLIETAKANAKFNGITNVEFHTQDLYGDCSAIAWKQFKPNKLLLDPPRSGAYDVLKQLPDSGPEKIVYVSCNPATLARDAGYLVNEKNYTLSKAGVIDMFPQTSHVESIAVFDRK